MVLTIVLLTILQMKILIFNYESEHDSSETPISITNSRNIINEKQYEIQQIEELVENCANQQNIPQNGTIEQLLNNSICFPMKEK